MITREKMIEISEPLPESVIGVNTLHDIFSDEIRIGYVEVGIFKKMKLKLSRNILNENYL